jgi:CDGSH-type Zn-finger protein
MSGHSDKPRIVIVKNGPYQVTGNVSLEEDVMVIGADGEPERWAKGKPYPAAGRCSLCRCGASEHPPFCDGGHLRIGFNGSETADHLEDPQGLDRTPGPAVDLTYSTKLCAEARFCHRGQGAWDLAEHSDDPAKREMAIQEACDCPSGALTAWDKKTGGAIEPGLETSIGLVENPRAGLSGPLWVKGGIPVESSDGTVYETRNRVTLCRCGASKNMPFCDGAHVAIGFKTTPRKSPSPGFI